MAKRTNYSASFKAKVTLEALRQSNPTRRRPRIDWNRSARGLCATR
jgi:hypothetical protein